jgi:low affinity Fe/Cu permease
LKTEKKETENMELGIESTDNDVYEETIGGLEDNELFAMIDTNAPLPVLLVTSQVFVDSTGKQASKSMTFLIVLISVIISILSAPNDIFLLHLVIWFHFLPDFQICRASAVPPIT